VGGVFSTTTSRSSSVDMSASSPSCPRLDPAACTGVIGRIKGQGGEMARTVAHGAGVGTASTSAGGIACELLSPSSPSSVRHSSMREPAAAAASGGRGAVLSPLPQLAPHPAVTAAGSVLSALTQQLEAGSARLTLAVPFLKIRRACSGVMPSSDCCSRVIGSK
jgi:hypothetical protein